MISCEMQIRKIGSQSALEFVPRRRYHVAVLAKSKIALDPRIYQEYRCEEYLEEFQVLLTTILITIKEQQFDKDLYCFCILDSNV